MPKTTSFLLFFFLGLTACRPLYHDTNVQSSVYVKHETGERRYLSYRLQEEIKRRLHRIPVKTSLIISIYLQEEFQSLVHLANINEGRSLGDFLIQLEVRYMNQPVFYKDKFRFMSAYTPDPYQEFANLQARHIIESQVVFRLAEEVVMRIASHIKAEA